MKNPITSLRQRLSQDFTVTTLKMLIILWAILLVIVAFYVDSPWILAGILLYEALP